MDEAKDTSDTTSTSDSASAVDIFLWANQTDAVKNDLSIELFLFNKLYTPFSMRYASELEQSIRALFLYDIVNSVNLGAGTGMSVREYELSETEENVILHTERSKPEKLSSLLHLIEDEADDIFEFSEEEHEFRRMKGVVARFTKKHEPSEYFYVVKLLQSSAALKGVVSWEINGGNFDRFKADVGLKIPAENHVLIVKDDVFIFSQSKFEKLFEYDYKLQLMADAKVKEIESQYKLSFPDELDLQTLVKDKPAIARKLQKIEIGEISQEKAIEYADEMQLELMTDDQERIIIMDSRDLDTFVNLINEDYITSEITGKRYVIKSKKLLDTPEGEPPRG